MVVNETTTTTTTTLKGTYFPSNDKEQYIQASAGLQARLYTLSSCWSMVRTFTSGGSLELSSEPSHGAEEHDAMRHKFTKLSLPPLWV
jgi:hypothetical protein